LQTLQIEKQTAQKQIHHRKLGGKEKKARPENSTFVLTLCSFILSSASIPSWCMVSMSIARMPITARLPTQNGALVGDLKLVV
jgi:hypothetical protein